MIRLLLTKGEVSMNVSVPMPVNESTVWPLSGFGGVSPQAMELAVNSRWITRNGEPWIPVMGEFHFSRFPREDWAESLGKMRAGGVNIVATYLFWIHHEEEEGQFRFDGDRDVGAFVRACAEQGLQVMLRIGPWAHGECRNGGFPDWLLKKPFDIRGNTPAYLALVQSFFEAIHSQVQGMMFKDGGPVIGVQLENEFGHCGGLHGEEGYQHIRNLKRIARDIGFEVPFYTTTGWGGGIVVDGETLPVLGGYADAPWAQHLEPLPPSDMFVFTPLVADTGIGTDLSEGQAHHFTYDVQSNPYFTAELGGGLQVTHHRRPVVEAVDVEAMTLVKLGCGANLLGYYMYHGGTNPVGKLSTLQESRATGYANDLPEWSYDFQAPLGEYGQVRQSWKQLRLLHLFLHSYGSRLAAMPYALPEGNVRDAGDLDGMRVSVRGREGSGFLFVNRHQRGETLSDIQEVVFSIETPATGGKPLLFPKTPLRGGQAHIWPFNMDLDGVHLCSATAQPLCRLEGPEVITHVFFAPEGMGAELRFADGSLLEVAPGGRESLRFSASSTTAASSLSSAPSSPTAMTGVLPDCFKPVEVLVLTRTDAENAQRVRLGDRDALLVSDGIVVQSPDGRISLTTSRVDSVLAVYPQTAAEFLLHRIEGETGGVKMVPCTMKGCSVLRFRFTPAQGAVSVRESARVGSRSPELDIRKAQWETNAYPPEEICHLAVELTLSLPNVPGVHDWFLELEPEGDAARLVVDGAVRGDWFFTGKPWEIGLKRYFREYTYTAGVDGDRNKDSLIPWETASAHAFRIEIDPLRKTDAVYLERQPVWHNGEACHLRSLQVRPQYRCEFVVR